MGSTASHSTNHSALGGKCRLGHRRFLEREGCPPHRPWESSARARLHRYSRAGSWGILCCWGGHLARTPPAFPSPPRAPSTRTLPRGSTHEALCLSFHRKVTWPRWSKGPPTCPPCEQDRPPPPPLPMVLRLGGKAQLSRGQKWTFPLPGAVKTREVPV